MALLRDYHRNSEFLDEVISNITFDAIRRPTSSDVADVLLRVPPSGRRRATAQ